LILFVEAAVKHILELGRKFPRAKPEQCPRCGGRLWGHGFANRYLDDCDQALLVRRYRCPDCRLVLTTRPADYLSRFQAAIADIRDSLTHRFRHRRWRPNRSRSRQRHWIKGLLARISCHLGGSWTGYPMDAFETFLAQGLSPVGRSI
jgi:hypothetical protein